MRDGSGRYRVKLLDDLVGAGDQRRGHREAKRLCSLEIDHELVFGRRLYRKIGRLVSFKNSVL
jgi:hypothetical protein